MCLVECTTISGGMQFPRLGLSIVALGATLEAGLKGQPMRVFKNKEFGKWAAKEGLGDDALLVAVGEMECGLVDADLGGHVVKKRVALAGRGGKWRSKNFACLQGRK